MCSDAYVKLYAAVSKLNLERLGHVSAHAIPISYSSCISRKFKEWRGVESYVDIVKLQIEKSAAEDLHYLVVLLRMPFYAPRGSAFVKCQPS